MTKRYLAAVTLLAGAFLLGGCAPAAPQSAGAGTTSQGTSTQGSSTQLPIPSAAAMVCSAEAKHNATAILGMSAEPATRDSWDGTVYSCQYSLPEGDFVMTVQSYESEQDAVAAAGTLARTLKAAEIKGLSNLGLPGYQATDGTVIFAKDTMVLHVDPTGLAGTVGTGEVPRADFAYQMATTILACWTHD